MISVDEFYEFIETLDKLNSGDDFEDNLTELNTHQEHMLYSRITMIKAKFEILINERMQRSNNV